jgi:hypothetical protein
VCKSWPGTLLSLHAYWYNWILFPNPNLSICVIQIVLEAALVRLNGSCYLLIVHCRYPYLQTVMIPPYNNLHFSNAVRLCQVWSSGMWCLVVWLKVTDTWRNLMPTSTLNMEQQVPLKHLSIFIRLHSVTFQKILIQ